MKSDDPQSTQYNLALPVHDHPAGLDQWFDALDAAMRAGTLGDAMYRKLSLDFGIEWLE